MASDTLKVLVVDDSEICRAALRAALESDPTIRVIGEARDGLEAVEKVVSLAPDLLTMDLAMPRLGGLEAIEKIMERRPTPILVVTERPRIDGVDATFASLARGAVDLVPKSLTWREGASETTALLERVKTIARSALPQRPPKVAGAPVPRSWARPVDLVALGASVGGPAALATILGSLPRGFQVPIVIVQHMDPQFHDGLVEWLGRHSVIPVRNAVDGARVVPGVALIGPPGLDFTVDRYGIARRIARSGGSAHQPSVDALFFSLARSMGPSAAGVLLTGMGADGADGLKAMRDAGALTVAQDRQSSVVYGMPGVAAERGAAEQILSLQAISGFLAECGAMHGTPPPNRSSLAPVRKTIVVLDDSAVVLEACKGALTEAGYQVVCVDNPLILPSVLRKTTADLVLIDVRMPAVTGDVVTKILAGARLPTSRVVLYSDVDPAELEELAIACGALGYICKGTEEHLISEVQRFLALAG